MQREDMMPSSKIALIYADESDFQLNPGLVGAWRHRWEQLEVPSAGQNRKAATFGGVDFATARMTCAMAGGPFSGLAAGSLSEPERVPLMK